MSDQRVTRDESRDSDEDIDSVELYSDTDLAAARTRGCVTDGGFALPCKSLRLKRKSESLEDMELLAHKVKVFKKKLTIIQELLEELSRDVDKELAPHRKRTMVPITESRMFNRNRGMSIPTII